ncbi:serine hydrolase domain-containing protein [Jiangella muralis]|uniref:serine hydrolase domain-containing protein n=1 Tax=Jiangella muralis TaxID=702383 RepID=UPI00069EFEAB|nr:serine hydrolase domain-containing protein [Jiangella muralis]
MTRFLPALLAAAAVLLAACTSDAESPASPAGSARSAGSASDGCDAALDAWADAGFSGSVAITTAGEPVCEAGYGAADRAADRPNTADTVFAIGSVTKAFTAAAVLGLADDGRLTLDDRVGDLLPELRGPVADATVRQLLVHTSGLNGSAGADHQPLSRDDALAAIGAMEQAFPPGTDYLYTNAGYTLLALVVEEVAGSYREHAATRVLRDLPSAGFWDGSPAARGDRAVGYLDDGSTGAAGDFTGPHWALDGNGALAMSMPDLAAWTRSLFTGGVVSQEAAEVLATPEVDLGDGVGETPGWVAYDASAFGVPFLASAGGGGDVGHEAMVVWIPDGERVLAVASNGPEVTAEELVEAIGPALAAGEPIPGPDVPGGTVDPGVAAAIVGDYRLDTGGAYQVSDDDGLRIAAHGADAVRALFPPGDPDAVREHERAVAALLAGETEAGREELVALDDDFGPIGGAEPAGTVLADGELRTYVTLDTGGGPLLAWYALNDEGGVDGVDVGTDPPAVPLAPNGDGFRPADPAGAGPDVTVSFGDDTVTVGDVTARRG